MKYLTFLLSGSQISDKNTVVELKPYTKTSQHRSLIKSIGLALIGLISIISTPSNAHNIHSQPITFNINFAQTYAFGECQPNAPENAACLDVSGVATTKELGSLSFNRIATVPSPAQFDPSHPTCLYIETTGTLNLTQGTLNFHAPGNVCFSEGIASYDLIFTGGTGAYAKAIGGGRIIVTPPESRSTGRELWHFELYNAPQK
jgi:hypothetical protein